jgi:membrane dipeptidase
MALTLAAAAASSVPKADAASNWRDALIINALGGLEDPNPPAGEKEGPRPAVQGTESMVLNDRTVSDALASGLTAINVTLGYVAGDMEPFEYTVGEIGQWDTRLRADPAHLLKVYTAADILRAKAEHKVGVIYGFQNAAMMGNNSARVELFANLGVAQREPDHGRPVAQRREHLPGCGTHFQAADLDQSHRMPRSQRRSA